MNKKFPAFSIIILLFMGISLYGQKLPKPRGYVNDFAGIIDAGSKNQMEIIIQSLKQKTGAEIAVVSVNTIAPYATIEEYSIDLASEWGIGKEGKIQEFLFSLPWQREELDWRSGTVLKE